MRFRTNWGKAAVFMVGLVLALGTLLAQEAGKKSSSYSPVVIQEDFASGHVSHERGEARHHAASEGAAGGALRPKRPSRPAGVTMSRGKAVQDGVRVKLRGGMTWERLAQMTP